MKTFKKIILGSALAASSLAIAAPASAQDYNRYHRHSGDGATAAIVGGVIGLALGAAIASSSNRGYDNYRNGTWYEGYQYRNGSFYDRQGQRRYDRNTWQQRHYQGDRDGYRGGYDQRDGYQASTATVTRASATTAAATIAAATTVAAITAAVTPAATKPLG